MMIDPNTQPRHERITVLINGKAVEVDSLRVDVHATVDVSRRQRAAPAAWEGTFYVDEVVTQGMADRFAMLCGDPPRTRYWARRRESYMRLINRRAGKGFV